MHVKGLDQSWPNIEILGPDGGRNSQCNIKTRGDEALLFRQAFLQVLDSASLIDDEIRRDAQSRNESTAPYKDLGKLRRGVHPDNDVYL